MARIQLPSVRQQVQQPVGFDAPRVAPLQDAAPQQLQALGQAQQAFGVSGSRISADLQDEYDAAILNKADLAADGVLNEEFGGYLSLQGEQATGTAKKDATAAATKRIRAIQESGLKTAAQRTLFEQQMTSRMQEWTQRADRHERDQVRNFAFGMHTAKAQSEGMDAAATVGTPMFLAHKDQMLAHVDSAADLQGLGADQKKLLRLGATTTLHKTVIDNMLVGGHATAAKDYLEGAQGEIAPEQRTRLQGLVQRATVDQQSFEAARFISAREPNLAKQIEQLNQLVESPSTKLPIEVRDAAEQRLRGMEQVNYQNEARIGNDAATQAEAFATKNRITTYAELPLQMRTDLEATGRSEPLKVWLAQGQQNVTTTRGVGIMRDALNPAWLRGTKLEVIQAATRDDLNRRDGDVLTAAWYEANELPPPKGVGDGVVSMTVTRRMMEMGYLPADKDPSQIQTNRRNWVLEQVQRSLGSGAHTAAQVDEAVEKAMGATMGMETNQGVTGFFSTDVVLPESAMTPKEREEGFYRTAYGKVPAKQVNPEMQKAKQAEVDAINAARSAHNAAVSADQRIPLLPDSPEAVVGLLRTEAEMRRIARDNAYKNAMGWMRSNRQEFGPDAWYHLPAELLAPLQATGMSAATRMDYENYDRTHDFLGRRNQPDGSMNQTFGSPWGR